MPRRTDIKKIMIVGSGPIVIGQACEFDYSGTQACKALKEEGYEVVLLNSNPATIMTDPGFADRTYVEPITPETAELILAREKPDVLLPTLGGQTALNLAVALARNGALARHGVELIGASLEAIEKAEDRLLFKEAMERVGVELPKSGYATSWEEARAIARDIGFPIIIRPSFTMGGEGGGVAYNLEEFEPLARRALTLSPTHTILCEESIIGWKEYELEVMRDRKDNVVIICSIENFDPMGVHTGDSITVAPAQTLTDKEYQRMREAGLRIIREIGVETGGSNIQFGVHPQTGRMVVIEMNPRVSRSSALASKATGFPIAKIAAKLAVGYTLDEIKNDITRYTPASFEPTIDYVVTKVPRFAFEKFRGADDTLTTQMKSVGEVMAIGRTFQESLQKAIRGLEIDRCGLESPLGKRPGDAYAPDEVERIRAEARVPRAHRLFWLAECFRAGLGVDDVHGLTHVDPWFLREVEELVATERTLARGVPATAEAFRAVKRMGFSDKRIAQLAGRKEAEVREARHALGVRPVFKRVDTCAAEFEAYTPYLYSTYEEECEAAPTDRPKVMILGGGPNRIGQGIEFDYCCVHASFALSKAGFETIMVNCNPETVSTDYDTSDRLYFEPLTLEDVLEIVHVEKPKGLIVQYGGQTPLKLAVPLHALGVPIFGTAPDAIDRAEDRERFAALIEKLGLRQPRNGVARSADEAFAVARRIGYPAMVRPSYVLGGRAMEVVYDDRDLETYLREAVQASNERPVLIDRFLKDAAEVDVDVVSDGRDVTVGGVMEHIEEAGIHSGDSACALPPYSLRPEHVAEIERQSVAMARELGVIGLMNVQFAIQGDDIYVLEVNPRASRTVPFVGKATGLPLAKAGALCMVGKTLAEAGASAPRRPRHTSVKEAVFPFARFRGVDTVLGPEMKSTGEVMGVSDDFYRAFFKAQAAAGNALPVAGEGRRAFVSVRDADKPAVVDIARRLAKLGFEVLSTAGTAAFLAGHGLETTRVRKVNEGRPSIVDRIIDGDVHFVVNTTAGKQEIADSYSIRRETLMKGLPYFTTLTGARAAVGAMEAARGGAPSVRTIQEYHGG
ncbi:carbamoyl-phosphate synthase large subunit [Anaeromyxobacter dehalogenans]|uniref:Carbamoyl phosphate synthase large chain n=1 Tax=Anaeromyxobacter dehalogenans (strain 2CP-C) TaxID=290397 RepID=Q2IIM6_ANADE|nr:carbamoyl-phosphate synthase large subunit [Anaeromyxobacter dehalogenans]ABC81502.1 carbamoyl-phosphate synthase large subunit [Anaeromyxobacter dehalogenans 2CP-C]